MDSPADRRRFVEKLRALALRVDLIRVPTAFGDRRNARIRLEFAAEECVRVVRQRRRGDAGRRRDRRLGAPERGRSRDALGQLRDGAVEVIDRLQGGAELGHERPDEAHLGRDDPLIGRERDGRFDRLDAWRDDARLQMGWRRSARGWCACQMDRFEGGPLGEKVAEDRGVFVGKPL